MSVEVGRSALARAIDSPASRFIIELLPTPVPPKKPTTNGRSGPVNNCPGVDALTAVTRSSALGASQPALIAFDVQSSRAVCVV